MRIHPRQTVIALLGLCTAACGDATGASRGVALCPEATWAAIEREGKSWESISGTRSVLPLGGGERIGLARIRGTGFPADSLQIYYVTAEQAAATFDCDTPPTKQELHGTVRGIGTAFTSQATIVMGRSLAFAAAGAESFTLRNVPGGPADLVATAFDVGPATIIRRGVSYPDGSTIPILDLSSGEAFQLAANTVTVIGVNFEWSATSEIFTQRGTQGRLRYEFAVSGTTTAPIYSVPESKLLDGEVNSVAVTNGLRLVTVYYRSPSDRTVELGPPASVPTVTRTGTPPNRNARIDVASQPEYGSRITLMLCGPQAALIPTIIATKEYFGGTPTTWSLAIPDLLAVQGFPSYLDDPRQSGLCGILVSDRPYLFSPRSARDGETFRSALGPGVLYTP